MYLLKNLKIAQFRKKGTLELDFNLLQTLDNYEYLTK